MPKRFDQSKTNQRNNINSGATFMFVIVLFVFVGMLVYTCNNRRGQIRPTDEIKFDPKAVNLADFIVFGQWSGMCKKDEYLFRCVFDIKKSSTGKLIGQIEWKPIEIPKNSSMILGLESWEYVYGHYDEEFGKLSISGYDKNDKHNRIDLGNYHLQLEAGGGWLEGISLIDKKQTGIISAFKTDDYSYFTDLNLLNRTYKIYNDSEDFVEEVSINIDDNGKLKCSAPTWTGSGKSVMHTAYYEWSRRDGHKGIVRMFFPSNERFRATVQDYTNGRSWKIYGLSN